MKPRKKGKFLTFIFSFMPGAAQMYMGFMKSGLSFLLAFFLPLMVTGMLHSGDYIVLISTVVYIVNLFHAWNLSSAPDEEFACFEDKYIWDELFGIDSLDKSHFNYKKWGAIALIVIGISGLWSLFEDTLLDFIEELNNPLADMIKNAVDSVPRLIISILVILIGIMLIRGKKLELNEENEYGAIVDKSNEN